MDGLIADFGFGVAFLDNDRDAFRNGPMSANWGWGALAALGYWFRTGPLVMGPSLELRHSTTYQSGFGERGDEDASIDAMAIGLGVSGAYQ